MRLNKMIMRTKRTILTVVILEKIIFLMLFIAYCSYNFHIKYSRDFPDNAQNSGDDGSQKESDKN